MIKISIVIPVYNSEKYIGRCLDSILSSTFKDYEILIMNDGSTDNSLNICKSYQNKYKDKIRIYTHENQGVALTRNDGIKKANGKYIMFIDNDDYITDDYLETYYKAIKDYDVVYGGYERVDSKGKVLNKVSLNNTQWAPYQIISPWAKIYKLSFIKDNNIEFLNSNIGEDIYFNLQVLSLTDNIDIINDTSYKWFYNDKSISNTVHKKVNKDLQFEYLLNMTYDKIKELNNNSKLTEYFFIKTVCWFINYIVHDNDIKIVSDNLKYYMEWLNKKFPNYLKNPYLSIFKPKGESLKNRLGAYLLVRSYQYNFSNIILKILK